jgi:hypothetical protein
MTPKQIIAHWAKFGPDLDDTSLRNLRDLASVALDDLTDLRLGYECQEGGDQGRASVQHLDEFDLYAILDGIDARLSPSRVQGGLT